ncbi:MAG: hypothetical protein LBU81_07530 [Methanosarcinales archaeon]|jgi:hypothetical protein|nr:hypothetical protein [Methanosarcinales archaeon]
MIAETVLKEFYFKTVFSLFVLLLLVFSSVPIVSAADGAAASGYLPADYVQSIIDNTPATDPAVLDEARSDPNVIAVAGTIPSFSQGNEAYRWDLVL